MLTTDGGRVSKRRSNSIGPCKVDKVKDATIRAGARRSRMAACTETLPMIAHRLARLLSVSDYFPVCCE